jgi:uncharacterized Zn finger protein
MWDRYYDGFYPRSKPRQAKGGIKAQSKRGAFGTTWWGKRWIEVLESFPIGARLQRGRSYARGGQVLTNDVNKGEVKAKEQGSMPKPYAVSIQLQVLSKKDWAAVVKDLAGQALFAAKLLAGEMPEELEKVFEDHDLSLFPQKQGDLETSCSCPDYSNPCKHIAAVYYLLAEEFDRDPFLLVRLRGLGREELCAQLTEAAPKANTAPVAAAEAPAPPGVGEALPVDPKAFWSMGELPADLFGDVQVPPVAAAWPKRLGGFPFWRGTEPFQDALEPVYRRASHKGLATFLGEARG